MYLRSYLLLSAGLLGIPVLGQAFQSNTRAHERIRIIYQDLSKWDKNKDGRLTGAERDAFFADKRKERGAAEAAARAAKPKPPKRIQRVPPPMRPEANKPALKGIPKNIEDAQRAGH